LSLTTFTVQKYVRRISAHEAEAVARNESNTIFWKSVLMFSSMHCFYYSTSEETNPLLIENK
jgi:hypothetical protein